MLTVDLDKSLGRLEAQLTSLEQRAGREFREEGWREKQHLQRSVDLRYSGQGFELNVPFSRAFIAEFHLRHQTRYGYSHPDRQVELVTLRLRARMKSQRLPTPKVSNQTKRTLLMERRASWFEGK